MEGRMHEKAKPPRAARCEDKAEHTSRAPGSCKETQRNVGLDAQNDHAESLGMNEELCDQLTEGGK